MSQPDDRRAPAVALPGSLRRALGAVEAGEPAAPTVTTHPLQGALVALVGDPASLLRALEADDAPC